MQDHCVEPPQIFNLLLQPPVFSQNTVWLLNLEHTWAHVQRRNTVNQPCVFLSGSLCAAGECFCHSDDTVRNIILHIETVSQGFKVKILTRFARVFFAFLDDGHDDKATCRELWYAEPMNCEGNLIYGNYLACAYSWETFFFLVRGSCRTIYD